MAFIEFHKGKQAKPEYEFGFYAGSLVTIIILGITFGVSYLTNDYRSSMFFLIFFVVLDIIQIQRAKAKSVNILEDISPLSKTD